MWMGGDFGSAQPIPSYISGHVEDSVSPPPSNVHGQRDLLNWFLEWFSTVKETMIELTNNHDDFVSELIG
jgi:hypothetical protein